MKIVGMILSVWLFGSAAHAQPWNEWFQQEETARRYSVEQIMALRAYAGALKKGYGIVRDGLQTIDALKKGDFDQHLAYITGLRTVNPHIKDYSKRAAILLAQADQVSRLYRRWINGEPNLLPEEKQYGQRVYQQLEETGNEIMRQLQEVCTVAHLEMDDAARLRRIDALHQQAADISFFARHLDSGFRQLAGQRRQAQKEGSVLQQFSLK